MPLQNLKAGIEKYKDYFLFVNYSELLNKPKETMTRIYDFLEIEPFEHNFDDIENNYPEGDYDLPGLHEVRKKVSKRDTGVILEDDVLLWATYLQKDLEIAFKKAGINHVF
jgi:sulfotransferase